jgi:hypothetical protein
VLLVLRAVPGGGSAREGYARGGSAANRKVLPVSLAEASSQEK